MGSIAERKRKDGSIAYLAQIVIKRSGRIVHRENKTFDRRRIAEEWLIKRESDLTNPETFKQQSCKTLADEIRKYIDTSQKQIGRTGSKS